MWNLDDKSIEEAKKKNRSKSYAQGLEEAKGWFHGPKHFPIAPSADKPKTTDKKKEIQKSRREKEEVLDMPPAKRAKRVAASVVEEELSESDEDAPYKIPYPDAKKAKRVRIMRKLGLSPPEGSMFKSHTRTSPNPVK